MGLIQTGWARVTSGRSDKPLLFIALFAKVDGGKRAKLKEEKEMESSRHFLCLFSNSLLRRRRRGDR